MKKTMRTQLLIGVALTLLLSAYSGLASRLSLVSVDTQGVPASGSASSVNGSLVIKNISSLPLSIRATSERREKYTLAFVADTRMIPPGESATLRFSGAILQQGQVGVYARLELLNQRGTVMDTEIVPMAFEVKGGAFRKLTQREAQTRTVDPSITSSEIRSEAPKFARSADYNKPTPTVEQLESLPANAIQRISLAVGEAGVADNSPRSNENSPFTLSAPAPAPQMSSNATTITGSFGYKGIDDAMHRARDWKVEVWAAKDGKTYNKRVYAGWLNGNGEWTGTVPKEYDGQKFMVLYKTANNFFELRSSFENVVNFYTIMGAKVLKSGTTIPLGYTWFDSSFDANIRAFGVGDIYEEGIQLWAKFVSVGLDPKRAKAITVYFPNNFHDSCTSCSDLDDYLIYIAQGDVIRRGTMQHELAHHIHYKYWHAYQPLAQSGGTHYLNGCAGTEMRALSEGFADFIPVWVQQDRTKGVNTARFGYNIENPEQTTLCQVNNAGELWVAGTLWDMHDKLKDGNDSVYWSAEGGTVKIFLQHTADSMGKFRAIYANEAGKFGSQYKTAFEKIFDQNHCKAN
jgi:hypothetical protein